MWATIGCASLASETLCSQAHWLCARHSGRQRIQTTGAPGGSSSPCPHPSERVTLDFTFLPEFPELGQSPAQSLVPSQWLSEFPGGRKSSLDYLLTVCLGFLPLSGVISGVAVEYSIARIPGHWACWLQLLPSYPNPRSLPVGWSLVSMTCVEKLIPV